MNYEITVVTGDVTFAGTNARVFIQIYGDKGKTEVTRLESRSNNFERRTTEIFKVTKPDLFSISVDYSVWVSWWFDLKYSNWSTDRGQRCREDIQDPHWSRWLWDRVWLVSGDGGRQTSYYGPGAQGEEKGGQEKEEEKEEGRGRWGGGWGRGDAGSGADLPLPLFTLAGQRRGGWWAGGRAAAGGSRWAGRYKITRQSLFLMLLRDMLSIKGDSGINCWILTGWNTTLSSVELLLIHIRNTYPAITAASFKQSPHTSGVLRKRCRQALMDEIHKTKTGPRAHCLWYVCPSDPGVWQSSCSKNTYIDIYILFPTYFGTCSRLVPSVHVVDTHGLIWHSFLANIWDRLKRC